MENEKKMKWGIYDTCMGKKQLVCRASDLRMGDFFVTEIDSWLMALRFQVVEINAVNNFHEIIGRSFYKGESDPHGAGKIIIPSKTWTHHLEGENPAGLPDRGEEWIKEECKEYGIDYKEMKNG